MLREQVVRCGPLCGSTRCGAWPYQPHPDRFHSDRAIRQVTASYGPENWIVIGVVTD
jgi:hypothetical protein